MLEAFKPPLWRKKDTLYLVWLLLNTVIWPTSNILFAVFLIKLTATPPDLVRALAGGGIGAMVGVCQWCFLRKHLSVRVVWIGATAVGFALIFGLPLMLLGCLILSIMQQRLLSHLGNRSIWWIPISSGAIYLSYKYLVVGVDATGLLLQGFIYGFATGLLILGFIREPAKSPPMGVV